MIVFPQRVLNPKIIACDRSSAFCYGIKTLTIFSGTCTALSNSCTATKTSFLKDPSQYSSGNAERQSFRLSQSISNDDFAIKCQGTIERINWDHQPWQMNEIMFDGLTVLRIVNGGLAL